MNSQTFAVSRGAHRHFISTGISVGFVPEGEAQSYNLDRKIQLLSILDRSFSRLMKTCFRREKHLSENSAVFQSFLTNEMNLSES